MNFEFKWCIVFCFFFCASREESLIAEELLEEEKTRNRLRIEPQWKGKSFKLILLCIWASIESEKFLGNFCS